MSWTQDTYGQPPTLTILYMLGSSEMPQLHTWQQLSMHSLGIHR